MAHRRLAAAAALLLLTASLVLAVVVAISAFPRGLSVFVCVLAAVAVGWWGVVRGGWQRVIGGIVAAGLVIGAVVLLVVEGHLLGNLLVLVGLGLALAAARQAFAVHVALPAGAAPTRPVLFYNPKSGGGKAERFDVAGQARSRGVEPIELRRAGRSRGDRSGAPSRGAPMARDGRGDGSRRS